MNNKATSLSDRAAPRISVVTLSYNQAEFLEECIRSVAKQNYWNHEHIIVDPGSTDGSLDIVSRYETHFAHIILEPDAGPADGLNKGFRLAGGDIFYFLNADDIVLPGTFNAVSELYARYPDIDVLYGNGYQLDSDGHLLRRIFSKPWNLRAFAVGASVIVQQATFFRRQCFMDAQGFNVTNHTCWDGELWVDMALAGAKFHSTSLELGGFRVHSRSISGSGRLQEDYLRDRQRIKTRVCGREDRWHDKLERQAWRIGIGLVTPIQTLYSGYNKLLPGTSFADKAKS